MNQYNFSYGNGLVTLAGKVPTAQPHASHIWGMDATEVRALQSLWLGPPRCQCKNVAPAIRATAGENN